MPLQEQPDFIPQPFADNGDKNNISDTSTTNGLASWPEGFNTINSTPLAAGGVAPSRLDFNGMFYTLSQFAMFAQQGGVFAWSEEQDYGVNALVQSGGDFYKSLLASGPSSVGVGAQSPVTATSYWQKLTPTATTTVLGLIKGSASLAIDASGTATVPSATTSLAGILKLATSALALAGVDDSTAMTPALVKAVVDASRVSEAAEAYRLSRVGAPHFMASSVMPTGYMLAAGTLVLFEDYPELYDAYVAGRLLTQSSSSTYHPSYFTLYGETGLYLPKLGGHFLRGWTSTSDGTAGGYNAAGLPNIEGVFIFEADSRGTWSGAMRIDTSTTETISGIVASTASRTRYPNTFDASLSNSIYGNSTTVMPLSTNQPVAIYLGQPA
ncbi:MAG: hypothetical protein R3Y11_12915 [Pseudomonadota bacterium]